MGKAKLYGMNRSFVPNAKMDMRFKKKAYQHGREIAERDPYELRERREMKELERKKANA